MADHIRETFEALHMPGLGVPHGFLTALQSECEWFELVSKSAIPTFVKQVHSARVIRIEDRIEQDAAVEADGMVTTNPEIMLGIVTADCAPVLLADPKAGVIGAAHAGWRGAVGGILQATVTEMVEAGADLDNIRAAVGPCIAQESYEVDDVFRDQFTRENDDRFFKRGRAGHWQFDLPGYVAWQLVPEMGIRSITVSGKDTYSNPDDFHSYRRATHRGEPTTGRQISLIALSD